MNRLLTATQARSITNEVTEFVNAQAEFDKSVWADRCALLHGKLWAKEWAERKG
jgi:hypothetical protein